MKATLTVFAAAVAQAEALTVAWGQSSAPRRSLAAPFGVQDALRLAKGGTRAVVVHGDGQHLNYARQLAHYLSTQTLAPKDARTGADAPLMADVCYALQELARDGLWGEAELACAEVHPDESNTNGGYLDVLAVGDCEVAVFRQCGRSGAASAEGAPKAWAAVFKSGRGSAHVRRDRGVPLACAAVSDKGIVLHGDLQQGARTARVPVQRGDVVLVGSDHLFGHLSEAQVLTHVAHTLGRAAAAAAAAQARDPTANTNDDLLFAALGGAAAAVKRWWARPWGKPPCGQLARELVRLAKRNWHRPTGDITAIAGLVR